MPPHRRRPSEPCRRCWLAWPSHSPGRPRTAAGPVWLRMTRASGTPHRPVGSVVTSTRPLGRGFGLAASRCGWAPVTSTAFQREPATWRATWGHGAPSAVRRSRWTTAAMSATRGWTRGTSTAYAYGTWSRAARSAVSLSRGSVQGRRIVLVATTCPTCGSVDVYHAGIRLGRVSLYSAKTAYRQLRWLPLQSVTRTGTVVVRTTSSKVVYVDGVAVVH